MAKKKRKSSTNVEGLAESMGYQASPVPTVRSRSAPFRRGYRVWALIGQVPAEAAVRIAAGERVKIAVW